MPPLPSSEVALQKCQDKITTLESTCKQLKEDADKMRRDFEYKRWTDNLMHSRDREELDSIANRRLEFRVLMTGQEDETNQPEEWEAGLIWLKSLVAKLVDSIIQGASAKIMLVKQLGRGY